MSPALLLGIAGLAILDSFNPATIVAVVLILLSAQRRPGLTAFAAVTGAIVTVFTLGAVVFLTAGAAAGAVEGIVTGLRFVAFGAGAIGLVIAGIRRLKDRPRRAIELPAWFTPWTALPFGALITAADLPNALPYFIAIERLVASDASVGQGLAVLAGYSLVYCVPCLVLLVVGMVARRRTRAWLDRLVTRLGTGVVKRSIPVAVTLWVLAIAVGTVPFLL